jgi:hypothetical protein
MKKYYNFILILKKSKSTDCLYIYLKSKNFTKTFKIGTLRLKNNKLYCFIKNMQLKQMLKKNTFFLISGDGVPSEIVTMLQYGLKRGI